MHSRLRRALWRSCTPEQWIFPPDRRSSPPWVRRSRKRFPSPSPERTAFHGTLVPIWPLPGAWNETSRGLRRRKRGAPLHSLLWAGPVPAEYGEPLPWSTSLAGVLARHRLSVSRTGRGRRRPDLHRAPSPRTPAPARGYGIRTPRFPRAFSRPNS
jgi:hypothetical protein